MKILADFLSTVIITTEINNLIRFGDMRIYIFMRGKKELNDFKYKVDNFRLVLVFNATFNNISAISWWSVLLVEETGVPGENHRPVASN